MKDLIRINRKETLHILIVEKISQPEKEKKPCAYKIEPDGCSLEEYIFSFSLIKISSFLTCDLGYTVKR